MFGDRRIDHAACPEFLQQSLRDLVSALILGDLLAHDEDIRIAAHFFGHRIAQRLANRRGHHLGAFGHIHLFGRGFCRFAGAGGASLFARLRFRR